MDPLSHDDPEQHCPHCGAWQTGGDRTAACPFCGGQLPWVNPPRGHFPVLRGLMWVARAYRQWSLLVFAGAIVDLLWVGDSKAFFSGFMVLFPFTMALAIAYRMGRATSRWIIAFLVLVDLGVVLAPAHHIFPWLSFFPEIPPTQNRIISWYILVYATLQFGVLPPIVFVRSLQTAWRGGKPPLATWICLFGFAVWGLLISIVAVGVTAILKR
jgi:hypothetical protein